METSGLESNFGQWMGSQSLGELIMGIWGTQASLVPTGRHIPIPFFSRLLFCLASWEEKARRGQRARGLEMEVFCLMCVGGTLLFSVSLS